MRTNYSAGGVVVRDDHVIVVNQKGDSWSLPKGHVEKGESNLEAAKREIYEESGVKDLHLLRKLGSYRRYRIGKGGVGEDKRYMKVMTFFLFTTKQKRLRPVDPDNPEARWIEKDKVAEMLFHPKDKEFFLKILKEI
jgi:ADP-ribose pyrophosphatase YjhB (NUDIX family)